MSETVPRRPKARRSLALLRRAAAMAALVIAGVVAFDLAAYFAFPHLVQRLEDEYASGVSYEVWRDTRLVQPFHGSDSRGFDIEPGLRTIIWHPGTDIPPYEIWGNSVGCFDDEPPPATAPDIYLAGDSFTWGYTPYEAKFGTILERETDLLVYACGVPHTGMLHQFDKFLEVAGSFPGWPALVIVNVFNSDIANDFAFPHTWVIDGVWVEGPHLTREEAEARAHPWTPEELAAVTGRLRYYLKTYSATANILNRAKRVVLGQPLTYPSIPEYYDPATFPIEDEVAERHRSVVREWIAHASEHGYELRFALIPHEPGVGTDTYAAYRRFLAEAGAVAWDFEAYVLDAGLEPETLYWQRDFHFSPKGNAAYAAFLMDRLGAEGRTGSLPERFAELAEPGAGSR